MKKSKLLIKIKMNKNKNKFNLVKIYLVKILLLIKYHLINFLSKLYKLSISLLIRNFNKLFIRSMKTIKLLQYLFIHTNLYFKI